MRLAIGILLACFICLATAPARAIPTSNTFASLAYSNTFPCPWNADHTACPWTSVMANGTSRNDATGAASAASGYGAIAYSSTTIDSSSYLPSLHAYASSNPLYAGPPHSPYGDSVIADANVAAVQGYRYTGTTPFTLTLTANMQSLFSRPDMNDEGNHSAFYMSIFDLDGYVFGAPRPGVPARCQTIFPIAAQGACPDDPSLLAGVAPQFLHDSGTLAATLSYTLMPGQRFYVGAGMDASACCGVTIDSAHSLGMRFNDASQLVNVPVITAVPEPGAATMLLVGLTGFMLPGLARKVRRARSR